MSTLWSQFELWRWGSTGRTPWVNSLQQENDSHCMMGPRFWEELPETKVENGNNNRKIHSAYLTVLYQETKVFTLQSRIKPMIRMARPVEVETGACGTGHPVPLQAALGGLQGYWVGPRAHSPGEILFPIRSQIHHPLITRTIPWPS